MLNEAEAEEKDSEDECIDAPPAFIELVQILLLWSTIYKVSDNAMEHSSQISKKCSGQISDTRSYCKGHNPVSEDCKAVLPVLDQDGAADAVEFLSQASKEKQEQQWSRQVGSLLFKRMN